MRQRKQYCHTKAVFRTVYERSCQTFVEYPHPTVNDLLTRDIGLRVNSSLYE